MHGSFVCFGDSVALRKTSDLHEFDIGRILIVEQFDVRRFLLADSPTAPAPERRDSFHFRFPNFDFRISF
jgi:hypothetical protein